MKDINLEQADNKLRTLFAKSQNDRKNAVVV